MSMRAFFLWGMIMTLNDFVDQSEFDDSKVESYHNSKFFYFKDLALKCFTMRINHIFSRLGEERMYYDHFIGGIMSHIPDKEYGLLVENDTTQLVQSNYDSEGNLLLKVISQTNFDMTLNKQIPRIAEVFGFNPTFVIKLEE